MNYKVLEEQKKVLAVTSLLTDKEFETVKRLQAFGYEVENVKSLKVKKKANNDSTWKKATLLDWLKDNKTDEEIKEFEALAKDGYFKAMQWFKKNFENEYIK